MSVKLREAAAAKLPQGALSPARLWPLAGGAAALAAGFFGAGGRMFGGMHPLGLCAVVAAPGLHCLPAAAGAALGYALGLPIDAAAPYLVAAAVLCLWRVLPAQRTTRAKLSPRPWGPWPFAPCAWRRRLCAAKGLRPLPWPRPRAC